MADARHEDRVAGASRLRLAPGIDILELDSGDTVLVSDQLEIRLAGTSAHDFSTRVLHRLDGQHGVDDLLVDWAPEAREQALAHLQRLLDGGALVTSAAAAPPDPFAAMLGALGVGAAGTRHLAGLRVGIVGAEGPGAHAAAQLAAMGVGTFVLVDPYRLDRREVSLWPPLAGVAENEQRQVLLAQLLRPFGAQVELPLADGFDKPRLRDALEGCDLLVHCFDKGHSASALWVNEHALASHRPAIFGRLSGHLAIAGPLVLPGESPCYLCSRMRTVAAADDYEIAMRAEELLDSQRNPRLADRPGLPPLAAQLGATIALELIKVTLAVGKPALVGHVSVFDGLSGTLEAHPLLQHPDCPACSKKGFRPHPSADGVGLPALADLLVSRRLGVVRSLDIVPKDPSEPAEPVVVRAELANHRFVTRDDSPFESCSGKGLSRRVATISALGEACERYAAARIDRQRITRGRRSDLNVASVDPVDLVLFADHQYSALPYSPWSPDLAIDWVVGTNLSGGQPTAVPALAAFMHYQVPRREEYLFPITSNGLAAGSSPKGAALAAVLEVIERDAFMIAWLQRLPGRRIEAEEISLELRRMTAAYDRRNVSLEFIQLPTDAPATVVVALGVDRDGNEPAVVVGLGCDLDPRAACLKAALEVGQIRPALKSRLRSDDVRRRLADLLEDPSRVANLDDHDLLYADRSMTGELDMWRTSPVIGTNELGPSAIPSSEDDRLEFLVDGLAARGTRTVIVDLSSPELAAVGVHAARAILTGFQPIHFGAAEARLGGERLYRPPAALDASLAHDAFGVNPMPHPLS